MAVPNTTTWPAEPHTLAKHAILKAYLQAWFPILTSGYGRAVYFDGFAGPGRYLTGEAGSPVIALEAACAHLPRLRAPIDFVFVEKDEGRASYLGGIELPKLTLPAHFRWRVLNESFESALERFLTEVERDTRRAPPTFAFIDPFGIDGIPFDLIARLLHHEQAEVLVTFMKGTVNRFVKVLGPNVNQTVGNERAAEIIGAAPNRLEATRMLYADSLSSCARFVRYFEMQDEHGVPIYDLFFATNHALGHYKMKEAMWHADSSGSYRFSDGLDPAQMVLLRTEHGEVLARQLVQRFGPRLTNWTSVDVVKKYVCDDTVYLARHAREALLLLENGSVKGDHVLKVAPTKADGKKRRPGSFPEGTKIRFIKES